MNDKIATAHYNTRNSGDINGAGHIDLDGHSNDGVAEQKSHSESINSYLNAPWSETKPFVKVTRLIII